MLKNTVCLVTGGASGLGRATVEHFLRAGSKVILADLPSSGGAELAKSLASDNVAFAPIDVTSEQDVSRALEQAVARFGRLDVAVNCAGIAFPMRTYDYRQGKAHSLGLFERALLVNTVGTFNVARLAAGVMGRNEPDAGGQRGVIVNTASVLAFDGQAGFAAYAASKAAIVGMTLPMARDLSRVGIRVVTVAPGLFETQMTRELPERAVRVMVGTIPFPRRQGQPEEFGKLVEAIVANPMLNGEVIRLDAAARFNM
ncbi:hypothetical protein pipiens_010115 [Culex pipiens pipiens]|uniref:3-hydroxyacyl-CoA dehydrogenase type-2 n=1 Tax=Culex pipiens pipiens TaxID=38569 RepID=A0ABD1DCG0_CULPP